MATLLNTENLMYKINENFRDARVVVHIEGLDQEFEIDSVEVLHGITETILHCKDSGRKIPRQLSQTEETDTPSLQLKPTHMESTRSNEQKAWKKKKKRL